MFGSLRIETFFIPEDLWTQGVTADDIPLAAHVPLGRPSMDGIAIEERRLLGQTLPGEERRYRLCYARIQGIICDLRDAGRIKPQALFENYLAAALMNVLEFCAPWAKWKNLDPKLDSYHLQKLCSRVASGFFPPEDARAHFEFLSWTSSHPMLQRLIRRAIAQPSLGGFSLSEDNCEKALRQRLAIARIAMEKNAGLVDVINGCS